MAYDKTHAQDQGDQQTLDGGLSKERMQELREAEQAALGGGEANGPSTPVTRGIRDQAAGKPQLNMGGTKFGGKAGGGPAMSQGGKAGAAGGGLANFGDNVRQKLKEKESDSASSYYKSDSSSSDRKDGNNKARLRKRVALAGALSGVLGGGLGFAGLGIVSGPLQFIHWGQNLVGNHYEEKSDQSDSRMYTLLRNMRLWAAGTPERTRMGMLANVYADKIESRFRGSGVITNFNNRTGFSNKIVIDPSKFQSTDNKFRGGTQQDLITYLQDERGIRATAANASNNIIIDPNQPGFGYKKNLFIYKSAAITAGYGKRVGAIVARIFGVRTGVSWHPIQKAQRKLATRTERRAALLNERDSKLRNANPVRVGSTVPVGENGQPSPELEGAAAELEAIQEEAREAESKFSQGDKSALDAFRNSTKARLAGGGLGVIGLLCLALFFAENTDEIDQRQKELVMVRMAANAVAVGDQLKSSSEDLDGNTETLEFLGELMIDEEKRTTVFDAMSYNAEMGKGRVGVEIPETGKIGDEGNVVTRILTAIPGLEAFCGAAGTLVGGTILFVVGGLLGGFIREALFAIVAIAAIGTIANWIADIFAAVPVDPNAQGADKGNYENYGARLGANDMGNANAGLPMTDADADNLSGIQRAAQAEEFQSKSLAYKLFNTEDSQSVIGQFIDSQKPDPGANVANAASSFLNIGKSFGSMFSKPLLASVGAAPLSPYNYGFPNIGFTEEEMNNPRYLDTFANVNRAADLLEGEKGPEYIERAKNCFGVTIQQKVYDDEIERWRISPPAEGASPTRKTILDPANKCYGEGTTDNLEENKIAAMEDVDWMDMRIFIIDSNVANALGCEAGDKEACCDVGMTNCGGGGRSGPITRNGIQLLLNGQPWKFAGMNADTWFGCWPNDVPTDAELDRYFSELNPNSLTRIWPYGHMDDVEIMDRIVASAHRNNQYLMVTLFDGNEGQCGTQPIGDVGANMASITPFIQRYAKGAHPDSDAIGFWELSNESCNGSWFNEMAPLIKQLDGGTLISTGSHAAWCYGGTGEYIEAHRSEAIDMISMHEYDAATGVSHWGGPAAEAARELNKPWFSGEDGFCCGGGDEGQEGNAEKLKVEWQAYLDEPEGAGMLYWDFKLTHPGSATATFDSPMWQAASEFRHQYNQ